MGDKIRMPTKSPDKPDDSDSFQQSYLLAADLFSLFAHSTALMIWDVVRKKELSVQAIANKVGTARHLVLNTLQAMEQQELLVSNARSKTTRFRIADSTITEALNTVLDLPQRNQKQTGKIPKAPRLSRRKTTKYSRAVVSLRQGTPR
jgi:hypothetical protein